LSHRLRSSCRRDTLYCGALTPVLVIQSDLRLRLDRYRLSYLRPSLSQKGPGRKADRFRVLDR
jgi:hypothetical protein